MNFWFRYRAEIALCAALAVLLTVWGGGGLSRQGQPAALEPMTIVLSASEAPKASEPLVPQSPASGETAARKTKTRARAPEKPEAISTGYVASVTDASSESHLPAAASASPASSHGHGSIASEEAAYIAAIRGHLQKIKRYPSGREASQDRPAGTAHVRFTLRRDGVLLAAEIERSSGSMLLDSAALATVRRGNYPAFPEPVWVGKGQQEFSVILEFAPMN